MQSRRQYLASAAAALSVFGAGCSATNEPATSPSDPQSTVTETTTRQTPQTTTSTRVDRMSVGEAVDGVAVAGAKHRHSAFYVHLGAASVYAFDGQAVFVALDATGASDPPEPEAFSLRADGVRYDARTNFGTSASPPFFEGEHAYSAEHGAGWVLFEVPCPLDAGGARVELGDAAWSLPGDVRTALAEPAPGFELVSFDHPDALTAGEPATLSATVRHTGGTGPLRLVFTRRVGHYHRKPVTEPVSAGLYHQKRVTEPVPVESEQTFSVTFDGRDDAPEGVDTTNFGVTAPRLDVDIGVPFHRS